MKTAIFPRAVLVNKQHSPIDTWIEALNRGAVFIYLFIYLFICLFIYLFIYLFVYLFIYLFIYLVTHKTLYNMIKSC